MRIQTTTRKCHLILSVSHKSNQVNCIDIVHNHIAKMGLDAHITLFLSRNIQVK